MSGVWYLRSGRRLYLGPVLNMDEKWSPQDALGCGRPRDGCGLRVTMGWGLPTHCNFAVTISGAVNLVWEHYLRFLMSVHERIPDWGEALTYKWADFHIFAGKQFQS